MIENFDDRRSEGLQRILQEYCLWRGILQASKDKLFSILKWMKGYLTINFSIFQHFESKENFFINNFYRFHIIMHLIFSLLYHHISFWSNNVQCSILWYRHNNLHYLISVFFNNNVSFFVSFWKACFHFIIPAEKPYSIVGSFLIKDRIAT